MVDACIIFSAVGILAIAASIIYLIGRVTAYFQQLNRDVRYLRDRHAFLRNRVEKLEEQP